MRLARTSILVPALFAATACESTPQPVVPTQNAASVSSPAAAGREASVPEPANVVAMFRWKNPAATMASLTGCAGVPSLLADSATKGLLEALFGEAFRDVADAKQLAGVIAMDAPIDGLVALDPQSRGPEPMAAVSVGLSSLEGARAAIEATSALVDEGNGTWRIGDGEHRTLCLIATSSGTTPARLICGGRDKDLKALAPYMARTLPNAPSPTTDLHGEFRWGPIDGRFGQDVRTSAKGLAALLQLQGSLGSPILDKALLEAASGLGDELALEANDLDKVVIDVGSDANACLRSTISLSLRGQSSWLAGTMMDRPERAGPPPAIFWHAPKNSEYAFYSRGGDPQRYTEIVRIGRSLVEGGLEAAKVGSPADRKAVADLLTFPTAKDAAVVQAAGHEVSAMPAGAATNPQQLVDHMMDAYFGWSVMGVEQSSGPIVKWMKDAVATYNRKALLDPLRKEIGRDAKYLPAIRIVQAPGQLGGGALDVEFKLEKLDTPMIKMAAGPGKKDGATVTAHVLVMADGSTTWVAMGANRDQLVKKLQMVKASAPATGTLASRTDLEPLRSGRLMAGGYMTLGQFTRPISGSVAAAASVAANAGVGGPGASVINDVTGAFNGMPHKGETPVFLTTAVAPSPNPHVDVSLAITQGTVEDVGTLVVAGLRIAHQLGVLGGPGGRHP